jgi:citrate synthase
MATKTAGSPKGLEGVVIAKTQLSYVDGKIGKLIYHGYPIETLAHNATFEEVAYLLWNNSLPNKAVLKAFDEELKRRRVVPDDVIDIMSCLPKDAHPMGVLRTAVSAMGTFDREQEDDSPEANRRKAIRLTARFPTIVAAWGRMREGKVPIAPRNDLGHAANFLWMLHGEEASEAAVRAIDAYLVLLADHGMNASTFSARVATSTQGDMYSAITTACGTLKGPLHGGANEAVMRMLLKVENVDKAQEWFNAAVSEGKRVMGIGHRVYKVEDPRATVLREMSRVIAKSSGDSHWFDLAMKVEELARSHDYFIERNLYANVDFYSAVALYAVGIPIDFFTPLFAMSRIAGWTAHVIEQWADNRLIRPRGEYVGPMDMEWVPLEKRK